MKLNELMLLEATERWVDEAELKQLQAKYLFVVSINAETGRGAITMLTDIPATISGEQAQKLVHAHIGEDRQADDSWENDGTSQFWKSLERVSFLYLFDPDVRTSDKAITYLQQFSGHDIRDGQYRIELTKFANFMKEVKTDWEMQNDIGDDFTDDL